MKFETKTIVSERLIIVSRSIEEMKMKYEQEKDAEMKQAYWEMYQMMLKIRGREELACDWKICLKDNDNTEIGGAGFKGLPDAEGKVEIGYGIDERFQNFGYATEAVETLTEWALEQQDICCVVAQADSENKASQRVLEKNGFARNGNGCEGLLFI